MTLLQSQLGRLHSKALLFIWHSVDSARPKAFLDCTQRKEVRQKSIVLIKTTALTFEERWKIKYRLLCSLVISSFFFPCNWKRDLSEKTVSIHLLMGYLWWYIRGEDSLAWIIELYNYYYFFSLNAIWQTPPPSSVAQTLRDDSMWHCVLMLKTIMVNSLMEAIPTKGQLFK